MVKLYRMILQFNLNLMQSFLQTQNDLSKCDS